MLIVSSAGRVMGYLRIIAPAEKRISEVYAAVRRNRR
jgi:hypothetical protein